METIQTAIHGFLSYCKYEKGLCAKTLTLYAIDLEQLTKFIIEREFSLDIESIDKLVLRAYIQSISGFKPKTMKRKIASAKAMFNFLENEEKITGNPFRKLKFSFREPKKLPNVLTIAEVEGVLKSVYKTKSISSTSGSYSDSVRDIAVIELLFASGVRVAELSHLKSDLVDLVSGQMKVLGKGSRERIIQVCNKETLKILKEYQRLFADRIKASGGFFFVNRLNRRFSEQSVRFLVKKHSRAAGIDRNITPHVFRHSFATLLLEEDVDIKYIQHLLGHSSIMTTQIYTHVNGEKQRLILSRQHPRKNFKIRSINR